MSCSRKVSQLFITSCQHEMALKNLPTHMFLLLTHLHYLQLSKSATCESIPNSMYRTHSAAISANVTVTERTCASAQLPALAAARRVTPTLTAVLTTTVSIVGVTMLPSRKTVQNGRSNETLQPSNSRGMSAFERQLRSTVRQLGPQRQAASPVMRKQHTAQHQLNAALQTLQLKQTLHGPETPKSRYLWNLYQYPMSQYHIAVVTHRLNLWLSR